MLRHAGSHSSSTVHLHGYLDMLMFRVDIYGHVRQPTHASAACSKRRLSSVQMYSLTTKAGPTHDEGVTKGGSHAPLMRFHLY